MLDFPLWKRGLVLFICAAAIWLAVPNLLSQEARDSDFIPDNTLNLGLDLQGGAYLLLEVKVDRYLLEQLGQTEDEIRAIMRAKKEDGSRLGYTGLKVSKGAVEFTVRDAADVKLAEERLAELERDFIIEVNGSTITLSYREEVREQIIKDLLSQSIEIVRRRVDETGTREPIIQRQGDTRILLQVPGLANPDRLKELLGQTAKMTFHLMDSATPFPTSRVRAGADNRLLEGQEGNGRLYMIKRRALLSGEMLVDSRASYDQYSQPAVNFRFNRQGAKKFAKVTKENIGKPFAIVLDGKVITAPVIQSPITQGSGIITGNFSVKEANDLALLLRAGALPAPLEVLEERTVGPSLGADSIAAGEKAALIGVVLVLIGMVVFYGRFGLFASIALAMNIVLIFGALSLLQATLTLPGIAGMVLTMGMAVDANILIFERIREETRIGKTPFAAVEHGFGQAFKTILDSNVTTLIATLLLYIYGSGPVKGFAVTLSIGIISSMFSAILLTRMMVVLWVLKKRPKQLVL